MPIMTAQDIKSQLLKDVELMNKEAVSEKALANSDKNIEVGTAIRRMSQSTGWKILEFWMLKQIDLYALLNTQGDEGERLKSEGRVYAKILQQVEYWIRLAEKLEKMKTDNKED